MYNTESLMLNFLSATLCKNSIKPYKADTFVKPLKSTLQSHNDYLINCGGIQRLN